ncbi:MAG: sulfatase [Anaerolineae bacterium]
MATDSRPNVIWVFGDQHRAQALGCAGDPNLSTPNLDRLAAEGLRFTQAVCGYPLCCPFRGSLLTSRYPHQCVPGHEHQLPPEQPTIAQALNEAGYRTIYLGKWHLDGFHERDGRAAMHIVPPDRRGGFDEWLGYENNNSQWDCWVHGGEGDQAVHYRLPGYETDALTDLAIARLRALAGRPETPFFMVLSVQPPHDPYVAPEPWMQRHTPGRVVFRPNVPDIPRIRDQASRELAGYYAMIENLDWNVGRLRAALEEAGLAHNTHLMFFSDHGDLHGSHGQFRKTAPWEESLRIPFIIGGHLPRYENLDGETPLLLNHVDIAPTTLGLCGIDKPAWMQGGDYSGRRVRGRPVAPAPDSAYIQAPVPTGHADSLDRPWRGVVTADGWKYVVLEGQPWGLFNLNEDPYELANLAFNARFRCERARLQERLAAWIADTDDSFALPAI